MRIEYDTKLDYKDVLIVPKRSTISSRSQVKLDRAFVFRSNNTWSGVPIIAANMDGVGTLEMDQQFGEHNCLVAVTKHYDSEVLGEHFKKKFSSSIYSLGISDTDLQKFQFVYSVAQNPYMRVCVDVANGYTQSFVDFIKRFRDKYPNIVLMAGNVVTPEMTEEYLNEDMKDRFKSFKEKAMIGGGLGTMITGMITALGEFTGWSDFELTQKIHDFVEGFGAGRYSGPITVAMVFAGLVMALKGIADRDARKHSK